MSEREEHGTETFERRLTLALVVLNLLLTTIAGFLLVGRYEAKMHQATEQLARKESDLREIELEFRRSTEQARLSANTMELVDKIIPNVELLYDPSQSSSEGAQHFIFHSFRNVGQVTLKIENYKVVVTTEPFGDSDEPTGLLKEGADYSVSIKPFRRGQVPVGPRVPYGVSLNLKPHIDKSHRYVFATLFVYYRTSPQLVSIANTYLKQWLSDSEFESVVSGRVRSETRLETSR